MIICFIAIVVFIAALLIRDLAVLINEYKNHCASIMGNDYENYL